MNAPTTASHRADQLAEAVRDRSPEKDWINEAVRLAGQSKASFMRLVSMLEHRRQTRLLQQLAQQVIVNGLACEQTSPFFRHVDEVAIVSYPHFRSAASRPKALVALLAAGHRAVFGELVETDRQSIDLYMEQVARYEKPNALLDTAVESGMGALFPAQWLVTQCSDVRHADEVAEEMLYGVLGSRHRLLQGLVHEEIEQVLRKTTASRPVLHDVRKVLESRQRVMDVVSYSMTMAPP